jgi:enoyl-[acyl-carrier protein] reductase I
VRVNAISPGPMKTLAGAAIGGARATYRHTEANAPLRSNATLEAVGGTAVYLASDYGAFTTGEIVRVDGGFHVLGMPQQDNLGGSADKG